MAQGKPPQDAFEANEMHDGARVVRRDKVVSRMMATLLAAPGLMTIALAIFIASTNATAQKPVPAAALPFVVGAVASLGLLLCGLGVIFGVLRTVVTERAVHVRYGLWGPTIPIESIRVCRAVDYDWTQFGGWGIRRGRGGVWAYVPAAPGKVLEITYHDGRAERRILIGAQNAAETVQQIERLMSSRAPVGKRIADEASATGGTTGQADVIDDEFSKDAKRTGR